MSLPLRNEPPRNSVLNIFPEANGKEKARPFADFRPTTRVGSPLVSPVPADEIMHLEQPIAPIAPAAPAASNLQRESHNAFELLDQAANVIPVLMARCRQLEADVSAAQERTRSEMEAAELVAQRYQTIVQELQSKNKILQTELLSMTERAQASESHNETIQINADRSRQQAAEAECLSVLFHDKVMAALGTDTPAYAVLQAMRQATGTAPAVAAAARARVA